MIIHRKRSAGIIVCITTCVVMILMMGSSLVTFVSANQQYAFSAASAVTQQSVNQPSGQINKAAQPSSAADPPLQLLSTVGGAGSGYFGGDTAVAENSLGDIFVTDHGNQMVQVFSPTGTYLRQFNTTYQDVKVTTVINGQYDKSEVGVSLHPFSIAINPSNGTTYVVGATVSGIGNGQQMEVFDNTGHLVQAWSVNPNSEAMASVAVDNQGYVYVAYIWPNLNNIYQNLLYKFTANGTLVGQTVLNFDYSGEYPYGISLVASGNYVYAAGGTTDLNDCIPAKSDLRGCTLLKLNLDLGTVAAWGNTSQFNYADGVAVSPETGNVFVSDTSNSRIVEYSSSGSLIGSFGSIGQTDGEFYYPGGLLINSSGYMYVADTQNDRVQIFNPSLSFASMFGEPTFYGGAGDGGGGFNARTGLDVINASSIYVLDQASFGAGGSNFWRISEVNSKGTLLFRRNLDFSSCKDCSGYFNGLVVNASNGDFYTIESFYVYNCLGVNVLAKFYANGTLDNVAIPPYAAWSPTAFGCESYTGIAANSSSYVYTTTYIAPTYKTTFEKLDSSLQTVGNFTFGVTNNVAAIAVDASGNYYVSPYNQYAYSSPMITIESATGTFYRLTLPGGWQAFTQLATDSYGNLYAGSAGGYLFAYHQQTQLENMSLGEAIDGLSVWSNQLFAAVVRNGTSAIFGDQGYQPFVIEQFSISSTTTSTYTSISGRVLDTSGNPVQGATVVASSTTSYAGSSELASFSTTTNSNGYYSMPVIKDSYFVGVVPPLGSNLTQQWYDNQTSIVNTTAVTVPPSVTLNFILYSSNLTSVANSALVSIGDTLGPGFSSSNIVPMVNVHAPFNVSYTVPSNESIVAINATITYSNGASETVPMNVTNAYFDALTYQFSTQITPTSPGLATLNFETYCPNTVQQVVNLIDPVDLAHTVAQKLGIPIPEIVETGFTVYDEVTGNPLVAGAQYIDDAGLAYQSLTSSQSLPTVLDGWQNNYATSGLPNLAQNSPNLVYQNNVGGYDSNNPSSTYQLMQAELNYLQETGHLTGWAPNGNVLNDGYQKMTTGYGSTLQSQPWLLYNDIATGNGINTATGQPEPWWQMHPLNAQDIKNMQDIAQWMNHYYNKDGSFISGCGLLNLILQHYHYHTLTIHLIDPSGTITNALTGAPIQGAQVTLYMLNSTTDTFQPLNDSSLFSPSVNPEITDSSGAYGWLVVPGEYFVQVTAQGYYPANSSVVTVPPAITDLNVALMPVPSTNASSSPPPSLVLGNVTVYTSSYSAKYILVTANATVSQMHSYPFLEMLLPQYGYLANGTWGYLGYYQGTFGAVSGAQQGLLVSITVSYDGVTKTGSVAAPALGNTTSVKFTFGG